MGTVQLALYFLKRETTVFYAKNAIKFHLFFRLFIFVNCVGEWFTTSKSNKPSHKSAGRI